MKIVIVGAGGRLGAALVRQYREKFDPKGFDHAHLDLGDSDDVREKIGALDFDVLINCAAFTNVDRCEKEKGQAFQINAEAPRVLAEICRDEKAKMIHFSTDYVFDGEKREPYAEGDVAGPISVYGESKREGEKLVLQTDERHLVVRVSWVFGPDRPSFIDGVIKRARENDHVDAIADKFSAPTYTGDVAQILPQFFDVGASRTGISETGGLLHFANAGECSWQEYAQFALDSCHSLGVPLKARTVSPLKMADMTRLRPGSGRQANWIARRPAYSVLSTEKFFSLTGTTPRNWRDAVADYVREFFAR
jgi:dTDP-4-dehydrorhamnose reductase